MKKRTLSHLIPCPECGAKVDEPCKRRPKGTRVTWAHLTRNQNAPKIRWA